MYEISHELQTAFSRATSVRGVADLLCDEMRRSIGVSSFNFMVISDAPVTEDTAIGWVDDFSTAEVQADFAEVLPFLEQEFYPVGDLLAMPRGCHRPPLFRVRHFFERSAAYNEFYKKYLMQHHIIGTMGDPSVGARGDPWAAGAVGAVGSVDDPGAGCGSDTGAGPVSDPMGLPAPRVLFTFTRSHRIHDFSRDEVHHMESVRRLAERAFTGLMALGHQDLRQILQALQATLCLPAALFDAGGHLLWISHEMLSRLEATHCLLVRTPFLMRLADDYRAMQSLARRALSDPAVPVEPRPQEADAILRVGEQLFVRVFAEPGCKPMALIAITSGSVGAQVGRQPAARPAVTPETLRKRLGLTPREAQVALLGARGYTALNIAAVLGIQESTVRVHLKRIYRKLSVLNRTELALRVQSLR
jgi:DNA-binding CsgD family transcriptional regulator